MRWAAANGKKTIEMTKGGQWLEAANLYGPNSPVGPTQADAIWRAASAQFARGASGRVNAFIKGTVTNPNKNFYGLELPILRANPNVSTTITYRGY